MAALPIGLAFGLAYAAMVYTIGPVSGCHINPAVTAAFWSAGRISRADAIAYVVAQFIGAFVGALLLVIIVKGKAAGYDIAAAGLGQNGWGTGYGGGFHTYAALITELVATFLFTAVILGVTQAKAGTGLVAGLIIGLTLTIRTMRSAPTTPPTSCETMYPIASVVPMRPAATIATVTAGLMWQPDTGPMA